MDKLFSDEVLTLIDEIKNCLSAIQLQLPLIGKYKKELQLKGADSQVEYIFHAYRGRIDNKYSLHLRFKENNIHLVRLCINGNYIHLYRFNGQNVEAYAYPLIDFPFDEHDNLNDALNKFINYVHISFKGSVNNEGI